MMAEVDLELMKQTLEDLYATMIMNNHGSVGILALEKLMAALHRLYEHVVPEMFDNSIVVFKALDDGGFILTDDTVISIDSYEDLPNLIGGSFVLEILDNGHLRLQNDPPPNIHITLSHIAVVYKYHNQAEYFYAKGEYKIVPKLIPTYASMFAVPTFNSLRDALNHYKTKWARFSSCEILSAVWRDNSRIFFKNAQEYMMRKSLTQFLKVTLREAEIRPEQIVDESHPVDIKVTWTYSHKLALIEIKWLGMPRYDDGHLGQPYTDYRAKEGAKQLAEYLEGNKVQAPTHTTRAYLVLIDGRRRGLSETTASINASDGLYYADKEISFDPKYHEIRDDFEEPIRMFVEPVCS